LEEVSFTDGKIYVLALEAHTAYSGCSFQTDQAVLRGESVQGNF
jgi:hypothetical protein